EEGGVGTTYRNTQDPHRAPVLSAAPVSTESDRIGACRARQTSARRSAERDLTGRVNSRSVARTKSHRMAATRTEFVVFKAAKSGSYRILRRAKKQICAKMVL